VKTRRPSPRLRGEGHTAPKKTGIRPGEGALPQAQTRGSAPSSRPSPRARGEGVERPCVPNHHRAVSWIQATTRRGCLRFATGASIWHVRRAAQEIHRQGDLAATPSPRQRARLHGFTDRALHVMSNPTWESEGSCKVRREILRSLTKKQESFSTVLARRMKALETKAFAFFIVMRTAMPYDGIRKRGEQAPPIQVGQTGDKISFHAVH
jgi:hypothetical protein